MTEASYIPALRYNWLTPFYDFFLGITFPEKKIKRALILQCKFAGTEQILDFGVGTATLSIMIKQQYPSIKITGIDVDKKILAIAEKKIQRENADIDLLNYDGFHIPLPEKSINKVVSSLVFHHIPTKSKKVVLKEIARILKPAGELHIADFGKAKNLYAKIAFGIFRRMDGEDNTRINSKGLLSKFIEEAGFEDVKERQYFNTMFGTVKLISAIKNEQ